MGHRQFSAARVSKSGLRLVSRATTGLGSIRRAGRIAPAPGAALPAFRSGMHRPRRDSRRQEGNIGGTANPAPAGGGIHACLRNPSGGCRRRNALAKLVRIVEASDAAAFTEIVKC